MAVDRCATMSGMSSPATLTFDYKFRRKSGTVKEFRVELDARTLRLVRKKGQVYPEWAKLPYFKCPNCPLKNSEHEYCPAATGISEVIDFSKDAVSFEEAEIEITTEARTYVKHTSMQHGLSSLIGLCMATSGCPILDKLRPMVRTHQPFATIEETVFRSITSYLMAQYFLYKKGEKPDWDMKNLVGIYEDIRTVNQGFFNRIQNIHTEDAGLNAVIHLDCFAHFLNMALLDISGLDEIECLYDSYLKNTK